MKKTMNLLVLRKLKKEQQSITNLRKNWLIKRECKEFPLYFCYDK